MIELLSEESDSDSFVCQCQQFGWISESERIQFEQSCSIAAGEDLGQLSGSQIGWIGLQLGKKEGGISREEFGKLLGCGILLPKNPAQQRQDPGGENRDGDAGEEADTAGDFFFQGLIKDTEYRIQNTEFKMEIFNLS